MKVGGIFAGDKNVLSPYLLVFDVFKVTLNVCEFDFEYRNKAK